MGTSRTSCGVNVIKMHCMPVQILKELIKRLHLKMAEIFESVN